jgi:hypothetical protein
MANMSKIYSYIWQKRKYPPFLMITVVRATIFGFSKNFPSKIRSGGNYWRETESSYFYNKNELNITANKLSNLALSDPDQIIDLFKISYAKAKSINLFVSRFLNNNQETEKKVLIKFFKKFIDRFYDFYCYGTIPILLGYSDNIINQRIDNIVEKKIEKDPTHANLFTDLMVSEKKLINHVLELKILSLALKAKKFEIKKQKDIWQFFKKDIIDLRKRYGFLSFDLLDDQSWDDEYFVHTIFEKSAKENLKKEIDHLKNYSLLTKKRIKLAERKLELNEEDKKLFKIARMLFYYKWAREYLFVEALYNFSNILNRLGKYLGLNSLESKYLLPEDFLNNNVSVDFIKEKIKSRLQNFLFLIVDGKEIILDGERAEKYFNKLAFKKEINDKSKF